MGMHFLELIRKGLVVLPISLQKQGTNRFIDIAIATNVSLLITETCGATYVG